MTRIIAVNSQKGGVGKTSGVMNLAACLNLEHGKNVLVVDLDPQANYTKTYIKDYPEGSNTIMQMMQGKTSFEDTVINVRKGLDIIPSTIEIANVSVNFAAEFEREYILFNCLCDYIENYDFVIFDCPATFELLTLSAFIMADEVLVPALCTPWGFDGAVEVAKWVSKIKVRMNKGLKISGVYANNYENKAIHARVKKDLKKVFGDTFFELIVWRSNEILNSPDYGTDVFEYSPKSQGAEYFRGITKRILAGVK